LIDCLPALKKDSENLFIFLDKLEKRTARAIGEIIRERLRGEDLANAVTAGASYAAADVDDE
jgi:hypothetical protein